MEVFIDFILERLQGVVEKGGVVVKVGSGREGRGEG